MNLEKMKQLREAVANDAFLEQDVGFNMAYTYMTGVEDKSGHNCKTVACLAGYTMLGEGWTAQQMIEEDALRTAGKVLDLSEYEMALLFTPYRWTEQIRYSKNQAVHVLDIIIEKGEVPDNVWDIVCKKE